jgi:hypothetical protein
MVKQSWQSILGLTIFEKLEMEDYYILVNFMMFTGDVVLSEK